MRRVPNWDIALHHWANTIVGRPYEWGATDCGTLVREAHRIMFGDDFVRSVKPYTTKRGALSRHAELGGVEAALRAAGAIEVPLAFAQQGDVLIEEDGDEFPSAAVVVKRDVIYTTPDGGVVRLSLRGRTGTLLRVPHG